MINGRRLLTLLCVISTLLGFSAASHASIIVFDNKTDFLTDTGALGNGPYPNLGNVGSSSQTIGDITVTGNLNFADWTTRLSGIDLAINGVENLAVDVAFSVFALGFDFVEPEFDPNVNAPFFDTTFEVTLFAGLAMIDSFTFNAPNDVAAFVGAWSHTAFDRVEIVDTTNTIDNEFFGEFYLGTTSVPEPSTLALLGIGLAGLGWMGRRKKTNH